MTQGLKDRREVSARMETKRKKNKGRDSQQGKVTDIRHFFEAKGMAPGNPLGRTGTEGKGGGRKPENTPLRLATKEEF